MDILAIDEAAGYTDTKVADRVTATHTYPLLMRLALGAEDAVWLNLSDSTGNGNTRWCRLTANALAEMFPTHTVIFRAWNITNTSYDAAVTIQTGTGPRKLTVYNGAASGMTPDYSQSQIASATNPVICPETPHLVTVNHAHNAGTYVTGNTSGPTGALQGPAGYKYMLFKLCRTIRDKWPSAGLNLTAQNPQAPGSTNPGADPVGHYTRARITADLAASEGYGLFNVMQAFLDTPNWATTLVVGDGVHPTDTGSIVWFREVIKNFQLPKSGLIHRMARPATNRLFLPASAFQAEAGSTLTAAPGSGNTAAPGLSFPQGVDSFAVASGDIPGNWAAFNAWVMWSSSATLTGNAYWRFFFGYLSNIYGTGAQRTLLANVGQGAFTSAAQPANQVQITQVLTNYELGARPLVYRVGRMASASATDTLSGAPTFHGLVIERAA